MKVIIYIWLTAATMTMTVGHLSAQAPDPKSDLTTMTLEELLNTKVTSVSKREEKLFQAAAAIYVITQEDIRRSGLTSLPELFRMVPGMEVARIDGNKWAIGIRGFNGRYSNKLLVLIDGRSIYSPIFSGVYWEAQQLPLEDIERIEVIRGPGGTLWGANAVDGVINIITKPAQKTQGGLVTAGGGSEEQGFSSVRYGGAIGDHAYYRVHAQYFNRGGQVNAAGYNVHDWQNWVSGGWRMDWKKSNHDALAVQGNIYDTPLRETSAFISPSAPFAPFVLSPGEFTGGHVLGRWDHIFSDRSDTALQIYVDRARHTVRDIAERVDTLDADFQHHLAVGRQEIVWGLGYRLIYDRIDTVHGGRVEFMPTRQNQQIFSGFVQDQLTLVKDRLKLTLGSKLEHNDYVGFEAQPSANLVWTPNQRQAIWASISRAARTPARVDRGFRSNIAVIAGPGGLPIITALVGNPNTRSEELRAYELGYRVQLNRRLLLDVSSFYNFYDRLESADTSSPFLETDPPPHLVIPVVFNNFLQGKTYGLEASVDLEIGPRWKVRGGYSYLGVELNHKLEEPNLSVAVFERTSPRHQLQFHSYFRLPRNLELNGSLYRVSRLSGTPGLITATPGYTRLDIQAGWKASEGIELSLGLQNLLDDHHPEFGGVDAVVIPSQARRSIYGKVTWKF